MDIRSSLNEKQYLASSSASQYLRIIAGAGTGKTRTLTYRIAYLITQGYLPRRMVAITFTNKATNEMNDRVGKILSEQGFQTKGKPVIATFHAFCVRFLRQEIGALPFYTTSFQIADESDQADIYKDIFTPMTKGASKDFTRAVVSKINSLKTDGYYPNDLEKNMISRDAEYTFTELLHVYDSYQKTLVRQNLLDFDDLLLLTRKILMKFPTVRKVWQEKYDIFLVDEFQDTNLIQYDLLKLFLGPKSKLTVVGDPDQTIYTWRGAKNAIIKDRLAKDFPSLETIVLDENYRSTQEILDAANTLIANNHDRVAKSLKAMDETAGRKVVYTVLPDNDSEGYFIAKTIQSLIKEENVSPKDIAVIYRSNYLSNAIEKQLTAFRIPYAVYGGMKFYERAEVKDALSYLRLVLNADDISFRRTLKMPTKGIGDVTMAKALSIQKASADEISLFDIFRTQQKELGLTHGTVTALATFYAAFDRFHELCSCDPTADDLLSGIRAYFTDTGFQAAVAKEDARNAEHFSYTAVSAASKVDNVTEFLRSLTGFLQTDHVDDDGNTVPSTLTDFLLEVALQSDQDSLKDQPQVALMTGHVSKGLEFPVVFVTGLVQGVFPNNHALNDSGDASIEEERRLLFVAMTRARKRLFLSSFGGMSFVTHAPNIPSQFIEELHLTPEERVAPKPDYQAYVGSHRPSAGAGLLSALSPNAISLLQAGSRPAAKAFETYIVGDQVIHTSFGVGRVTEVYPDHKIQVDFGPEFGSRKLMLGFNTFRKKKEGE